MKQNKIANIVMKDMDKIANSPQHINLFKKADKCCPDDCTCKMQGGLGRPCSKKGECDPTCSCANIVAQPLHTAELFNKLISLSEDLDKNGLFKSATLALVTADELSKLAKDKHIDPTFEELLDTPPPGDYLTDLTHKEIKPLSEIMEDPSYDELDELLKDKELAKILNEVRSKKQLDRFLKQYEPSLKVDDSAVDDDDLTRANESGYTHGRLQPHKFESTRADYEGHGNPHLLEAYIAGFHEGEKKRLESKKDTKKDDIDDYEECGTCGYDHAYDLPLITDKKKLIEIGKAHKADFDFLEPEAKEYWENLLKEDNAANDDLIYDKNGNILSDNRFNKFYDELEKISPYEDLMNKGVRKNIDPDKMSPEDWEEVEPQYAENRKLTDDDLKELESDSLWGEYEDKAHRDYLKRILKEDTAADDDGGPKQCNCENLKCFHYSSEGDWVPCPNEAGSTKIEYIGKVCDECALNYPFKYHLNKHDKDARRSSEIERKLRLNEQLPYVDMTKFKRENIDPDKLTEGEIDPLFDHYGDYLNNHPRDNFERDDDFNIDSFEKHLNKMIEHSKHLDKPHHVGALFTEKSNILKKIKDAYKNHGEPSKELKDKLLSVNEKLETAESKKHFGDE